MKCPNCDFIEKDEAFGQPPQCPSCGVFYDKALKVAELKEKLRQEKARHAKGTQKQDKRERPPNQASSSKLVKGLKGAAAGLAEARASRRGSDTETLYTKDGRPVVIRTEKNTGCLKPILVFIGIIFVISLVTQCVSSYQGYTGKPSRSHADDAGLLRIKIQRLAREGVKTKLHDPDTAKFRNQIGGCGEVNAKNLFGGYTGYKRFMYSGEGVIFIDGDPALEAGAFDSAWDRLCGPGGKLTFPE